MSAQHFGVISLDQRVYKYTWSLLPYFEKLGLCQAPYIISSLFHLICFEHFPRLSTLLQC